MPPSHRRTQAGGTLGAVAWLSRRLYGAEAVVTVSV